MRGGALGPFAYVMPALSKTGANAAFYSDTFRPSGVTRLKLGAMTLGERDGAPFFHCHGLWTEADGRASRRPYSARGEHRRRTVRGRSVRHRRRDVHGRARSRDQLQTVRAGRARRHECEGRPAAPSRCGCGRTRILPRRWRPSAGSAASCARRFTAASAAPSARISADGRTVVPFATELAIKAGSDRARRRRHAGGGARCCPGRLSRRHRRGPADARRQSGADDDGAGARGDLRFS